MARLGVKDNMMYARVHIACDVLRSSWKRIAVGGCWWGFFLATNLNGGVLFREERWGSSGVDVVSLACLVAMLFALSFAETRLRGVASGKTVSEAGKGRRRMAIGISCAAFLCALVSLVIGYVGVSASLSVPASSAVSVACSMLIGCAVGVGFYMLGGLNAPADSSTLLVISAAQVFVSVVLFAVLSWLATRVLLVVVLMLYVVFLGAVLYGERVVAGSECNAANDARQDAADEDATLRFALVLVDMSPKQLFILVLLIGLSDSITRGYVSQVNVFWQDTVPFEAAATLIAVVLLLVIFLFMEQRTLLEQLVVSVVMCAVAGIVLNPLLSEFSFVPIVIHQSGFICLLLMLCYCASAFRQAGDVRSIPCLTAQFVAMLEGGVLLGALVPARFATLASSVLLCVLVVAMVVAFMLRRGRIEHPDQQMRERRKQAFGDRYGLTNREREVLSLLLKRYSYNRIAESLSISKNTVKTHVQNIYEKTGVSSRDELLEKTGLDESE